MGKRAGRSLKASTIGISRANQSLLNFESKLSLADELEISRATVQKFFVGKPIGRENFHKICQKLQLPWQAIAEIPDDEFSLEELLDTSKDDVDTLVKDAKQKVRTYIESKCGIVRVLNRSQPTKLNDIFTKVNVLEKIGRNQRISIKDFLNFYLDRRSEFSRLYGDIHQAISGIKAIEKYPKLIISGKPGSGKTTFLKYIATQCIQGRLFEDLLPIYISLKVFTELEHHPTLLEWISTVFNNCGVEPNTTKDLLAQGRMLVLLDGLDEVRDIDNQRVSSAINSFYNQFDRNRFIITCRIAAQEFTIEEFVEVELANFDDNNIAEFVSKWFAEKPDKISQFLQTIKCNASIRELANNPLLLTLLCSIFEETNFPNSHLEIYREGIDLLLKKWDAKRNIERKQIYQNLSLQHKEDLLSHIAFTSFLKGEYFLKQQELEQYIINYVESVLQGEKIDLCDSTAILQSIEAQHGLLVERARGIYSFSHLTFQEYFTARKIAYSPPQTLNLTLERLSDRLVTDKRWREVALLTVGMLKNADYFLLMMKQKTDTLILDPSLQRFLQWVNCKAAAASVNNKSATVKAFYYDLALAHILSFFGSTFEISRTLEVNFNRTLEPSLALDLALDRTLLLPESIHRVSDPERMIERVLNRAISRARNSEPELARELQKMKQQLSNLGRNKQQFQQWWQVNGKAWTEQLKQRVRLKRNIGHNWQFSQQQKQILKQYYDANLLVAQCLNTSLFVSREVREKIERTLLLPLIETSD
ncbi:NACHT domain-containing NTPase [Chroococcidiopsis sp. FACHB-1243]|uniref:NACHT domain-containing protein n=1 Tax=Chroococcidiopsis sp. [FACHB-1243] TaxID=2692781 RepID=UPI00177A9AD0|nr:NACHT domain-containing NTPase [Chroococcidiopsis sp. [FACHB-1243]]MBD2306786.1 NACHT domain-containing NTPase [Chroococcidiopsis sp. [FACHB-1243]]